MYDVVVRVDEKEFRYQFKYFWQVEWFVRVLNFVVGLIVKRANTGLQADVSQVALDGTFRCPECQCMDEHNPICSRR